MSSRYYHLDVKGVEGCLGDNGVLYVVKVCSVYVWVMVCECTQVKVCMSVVV